MTKKYNSKKATKKAARNKKIIPQAVTVEKEPDYMIQISDPKMLRKDVLESLREVIIFMQGYEKFRKIQEEKVFLFKRLRVDIRELTALTNNLRKYLPKGRISPIKEKPRRVLVKEKREEPEMIEPAPEDVPQQEQAQGDLEELDSQLSDIESQLSKIQ